MCIYTLSEKRTKDCRRALPAVGDLRRQLPLGLAPLCGWRLKCTRHSTPVLTFWSGNWNPTSTELLQYLARRPGWHGEEARDARLVLRVLGVLARGEGLGNVE